MLELIGMYLCAISCSAGLKNTATGHRCGLGHKIKSYGLLEIVKNDDEIFEIYIPEK